MNKSGNENRSVRNTRKKIHSGLLQLMEHNPIQEITVKDLTTLIDISRGTFYCHYKDIYDVLEEMENSLIKEIENVLEMVNEKNLFEESFPVLEKIFELLKEEKSFCDIMFGPNGDPSYIKRLTKLISRQCSDAWCKIITIHNPDTYNMLNSYIINGIIGLCNSWFINGLKQSPKEMAVFTANMIFCGAQSAVTNYEAN